MLYVPNMYLILSRLEDVIHGYIHERVHCDKRNLAQERAENKRLFPVGEDVDTIIMQLEIIKVCLTLLQLVVQGT